MSDDHGPCTIRAAHCADCGSQHLHEGPNDPPPWCCCLDCGSADIAEVGDVCGRQHRTDIRTSDTSRRNTSRRNPTELTETEYGMSDTITIKLVEYGETTVTLDRAEYEQAKADDKLDHLLDHDASDMETQTTVVEPDGNKFDLYR